MPLNLAKVRKDKKLSQRELAKRAGVGRSYISELESGKYDPSLTTICKLCRALECEPNDLINCKEGDKHGSDFSNK